MPSPATRRATATRGFTIIELVLTMAVVGVLAAMAMPSLQSLVAGQRLKTATSDVYSSLVYARSEAIKRGQFIGLCASTNGTTCTGATNWETGWIVFLDADGDGAPASAADVLKKQDPLSGVAVAGTNANLSYRRDGRLVAAVGNFVASAPGVTAQRCVRINVSGQPNTKEGC